MTRPHKAEVPNMSQRTVMQCLSLEDWKVVAHLAVPVGELMVSRLLEYGWIESRSEKQGKAIRLTPAGYRRCGPTRFDGYSGIKRNPPA
jgi:hypothetical protein